MNHAGASSRVSFIGLHAEVICESNSLLHNSRFVQLQPVEPNQRVKLQKCCARLNEPCSNRATVRGVTTVFNVSIDEAEDWVRKNLDMLCEPFGEWKPSSRFLGGQSAATRALSDFDPKGYASNRNQVLPATARGASALSPYIRHGLLTLPEVWSYVSGAPERDRDKFRDELLWQEYTRHLYARLGTQLSRPLRHQLVDQRSGDGWSQRDEMACLDFVLNELEADGWIPNQTRMWLASHWAIRKATNWQEGERRMFSNLLDGSYANRAGWQWTAGLTTGQPYGFSRLQVSKQASELCPNCPSQRNCPIEQWPDEPDFEEAPTSLSLRRGDHSPNEPNGAKLDPSRSADVVWITAESLGDSDPALTACPDLPVVFVFDIPLLQRLNLHPRRLVFLTECLADLAQRRNTFVVIGNPVEILGSLNVAVTVAPVPGFRSRSEKIRPAAEYPWPWLAPISDAPLSSFSAWRRTLPDSLGTSSPNRPQLNKRRE
jgi:deoxyribodipyrimidine photo-lyase